MTSHEAIESGQVVERYVLGRLSDEEQSEFEDHYVDCERCLEAVELAQEIHSGLRAASSEAERETKAAPIPFRRPRDADRSQSHAQTAVVVRHGWRLAAAVAFVALLPSVWLALRNDALRDELEQARQPWVTATPDASLSLQRDSAAPLSLQRDSVDAVVNPRSDAAWVTLSVDVGDLSGETDLTLDVRLERDEGDVLWSATGLPAPPSGRLRLNLPRDMLAAGRYRLEVALRSGERSEPAGSYVIEVASEGG